MSISTALEARRDALREREAGFTLIELLVVVIIIGILAAIAIPVYLGVQNNAKDSAVKNDLTNAKVAIVNSATDSNGALPASIAFDSATSTYTATMPSGTSPATVALTDKGWSKSTNTTSLVYKPDSATAPTKWCVLGTGSTNNKFVITSTSPVAPFTGTGDCTPN